MQGWRHDRLSDLAAGHGPGRRGAAVLAGRGCRHLLPSIAGNEQQLADQAVHSWYGVDDNDNGNLTVTDTRVCTAKRARACASAAVHTSVPNTSGGQLVADDATRSLYLIRTDQQTFRGSVAVLDTRTCNATVHSDCSPVAPPTPLPNFTAVIASTRPRTPSTSRRSRTARWAARRTS